MLKQILFSAILLLTIGIFTYTVKNLIARFKLTKPFKISNLRKRIWLVAKIAIGQKKIFRFPFSGVMHALVFWGFVVILIGSAEMIIDGVLGTDRVFAATGPAYDIVIAAGDVFAFLIWIFILIFLFRRTIFHVKRFDGIEMSHRNHQDAFLALTIILLLMFTLMGMNTFYAALHYSELKGTYPVSGIFGSMFIGMSPYGLHIGHEIFWWSHILLIFIFANLLPYSKHFHVFLSVPNVFLSRLDPLGQLPNMDNVTKEVKIMMDPILAYAPPASDVIPDRFGVKDIEDVSWKNYLDSLTCTQCGRCTSVCPANITGKKLSPRKIMMDIRARMDEKGPELIKYGKSFSDNKSLVRDYISLEEIWACTTCNACANECPININHPTFIVDMRRYLVMEESSAPVMLNAMFNNIQNNGAPWQFSPEDRLIWTKDLTIKAIKA